MNPDPADTSSGEVNSELSALRGQVFNLLVALVVVSGTLTLFLFRQASMDGKDLDLAMQRINSYNQLEPALKQFAGQLSAYGITHPDIRPLLNKYGIPLVQPQPGALPPPKR